MENISKYVKKVRLKIGKTQVEFGALLWPKDNPVYVRNRISKYEIGQAIPPGDVLIRIQEIDRKNT